MPGYWMHETTGVLKPAVHAYFEGGELTREHIGALRAYLRQWMAAPWRGPEIPALRASIDDIFSRADLKAWIDRALDVGIDPFWPHTRKEDQ